MASNRQLYVEIIGDDRSLQRAYKRSAEGTARLNHEVGRVTRGVAAGSGVFRSLGRSLAFASGGFIAAAGAADLIRGSIEQASQAAATQKQLAAQFKASGQNLADYRDQIDKATAAVSQLAGFEDDQLTQAFTTAFRASHDVTTGLKIQAIAADVARARHIDLQTAALALSKAYVGQATALKRLGVLVPAQLHGMAALNFVQQRFAGQARAGTTAQERFSAAFANFEEKIGLVLLPTFNHLLDSGAKWLNNTNNQRKVQEGVNKSVSVGGKILHGLGVGIGVVNKGLGPLAHDTKVYTQNTIDAAKATHDFTNNLIFQAKALKANDFNIRGGGGRNGGDFLSQTVRPFRESGASIAPNLPRASLAFQISIAQERLAKAELTAGLRDDRAILVRLAALTRRKIAATKELGARTALEQTLGSITQQIASIDAKATADKQAQNEKALQLAKARRDKELAQQKKIREAIQSQSDKVNAEFKKMLDAQKAAAAKLKARLKAATDAVRQQIGDLFTGPILNPTDAANKGILGVTGGGGPTIGTLTRDVVAQTAGFITRNADLARLARAGAPGALLKQLRDSGDSALIHTLATGSKAAQSRLFKAVSAQEKVIQQIAHADIQARTVVVHSGNVRHTSVTPQSQRRGRGAGIVQGGYLQGD